MDLDHHTLCPIRHSPGGCDSLVCPCGTLMGAAEIDAHDGWRTALSCLACDFWVNGDDLPDRWHEHDADGDVDPGPVVWELGDETDDNAASLLLRARWLRLSAYRDQMCAVAIAVNTAADEARIAALEQRAAQLARGEGPPAGAVIWVGKHWAIPEPLTALR